MENSEGTQSAEGEGIQEQQTVLPARQTISQRPRKKLLLGVLFVFLMGSFVLLLPKNVPQQQDSRPQEPHVVLDPQAEYVPDQLIVKFKPDSNPDEIQDAKRKQELQRALQQAGVTSASRQYGADDPVLRNYYILRFKKGTNLQRAGEILSKSGMTEKMVANYIRKAFVAPDDSLYSKQWDLSKVAMEDAWSITKGSTTVIVGDIDSGVDYNHEDLSKNTFILGPDYIDGDNDPMDEFGHGTHLAGTIGALTNNAKGISGTAWNVSILIVRALDQEGAGNDRDITSGIKYAVDNGAKVINLSLGGGGACSNSSYPDIINYALQKGVTIVVAAGNDSKPAGAYVPGNCEGVITIGATDQNDQRASFSNYGSPSTIALSAPGTGIISAKSRICPMCNLKSATVQGNYLSAGGTSMAAPHVAGVVALLLSQNPNLTPPEIKDCLVKSADPIQTDKPIGPRLNAYKALQMCGNLSPTTPPVTITQAPSAAPSTALPSEPTGMVSAVPSLEPSDMPSDGPLSGAPSLPVANPSFPVLGDCNADNSCPTPPPANPGGTGGGGSTQCNIQINGQSFDCGSGSSTPGLGGGTFSIFVLLGMLLKFLFGGLF